MMEEKLSPKVIALFEAVRQLLEEDADINKIKVVDITDRAGIGKGTAYEYFSNKEEIICNAIMYHIGAICLQFWNKAEELNSFSQIIEYALNYMETEIVKRDCFVKLVHIFSGNGEISRMLNEMLEERRENSCMPEELLEKILKIGIKNGEIKKTAPKTYMTMTLASKLLMYAVYLTAYRTGKDCTNKEMHHLIYISLLKEFNDTV